MPKTVRVMSIAALLFIGACSPSEEEKRIAAAERKLVYWQIGTGALVVLMAGIALGSSRSSPRG